MSSLEQSNQNVQALSPYKLNLENLPPEIIGLIIGDSEHNSNASKLCLISKRFFHAAYPRLYSSVSLRWNEGPEDPHTVGTPVAFASSIALKGHTQWRSYLRRMKIMGVMKWNKARYWAIATIARELAKCENVLEFEWSCIEGPPLVLLKAILTLKNIETLTILSCENPQATKFSTMWSLSSLLRKMRGSDYPYLQSLWLGPICSVEALRHLGQAISTLRLDKLCVSGILWCASRPLQLRHLVDSVEAGSHQPSYQKWNGFDLEKVVSRPGNLLGTDSLRTLELSDCSNVNGLISTLGEQSEPEKSLRALMIENRLPSQISSMIYAIEAANEPPEDRIEIQPNHADFIIELIENSRSLESLELDLSSFSAEEATQVLESLQFSREALKYLRLNVFRNFVWLSLGTLEGHQSLDFFTPLALTRLSTFQNLRQLSICLNLRVDKISHVCRSFPPRLELLELSYVNKGYTCSFGTTVRELMLMIYTLKHRAAIAGLDFPLECIVMTELKCRARRDSLQTTIYIVHGKTGRVTAHEGLLEKMRLRRGSQTIFEFAKIGLGFDGSSP